MWCQLFGVFGEPWICPLSLESFLLTKCLGFGVSKESKGLWKCFVFAFVWGIWLERNARIFRDSYNTPEMMWDRVAFFASLLCVASGFFKFLDKILPTPSITCPMKKPSIAIALLNPFHLWFLPPTSLFLQQDLIKLIK